MQANVLIGMMWLFAVAFNEAIAQTQPQTSKYDLLIQKAQKYYRARSYKKSALTYTAAFTVLGGKGFREDRYDAACSWAQAGYADSAFFNLERIATVAQFADYTHLCVDKDLTQLHSDPRWVKVTLLVQKNKEREEEQYNKPVFARLDSIYRLDQEGRARLEEIMKTKGILSNDFQTVRDQLIQTDSMNLRKVRAIIDRYGWLGSDEIGEQGNTTLFLVIQHADLITQQTYLPLLRAAVKEEKAEAAHLALLEDRVALGEGRRQLYGSQIGQDRRGKAYVLPLLDPDQVDKRRAEVGLEPIREYVSQWNIKWNSAKYKKQLTALEKEKRDD